VDRERGGVGVAETVVLLCGSRRRRGVDWRCWIRIRRQRRRAMMTRRSLRATKRRGEGRSPAQCSRAAAAAASEATGPLVPVLVRRLLSSRALLPAWS